MKPSEPIVIDGETYDLYTLNLAVTSKYLGDANLGDASEDASIAMRLIPTRIQDGEVIISDGGAKNLAIGTLAGADEITMQTAYAIQAAIQNYINVKGL